MLKNPNWELVIFKSKRKQFDGEIKLKLSRNRLFPTDSIKYLVVNPLPG